MSTRPDESRDTGITCCGQPESGCGEFCPRMGDSPEYPVGYGCEVCA